MTKTYKKFKKLIEKNESSWINLAILSIIALFVKQYCTHLTYKNLSIYWFKYYINSFCTDLMVILIILCLTTLNQFIKNRKIKIFNNIISFIILIIFCIDIFTIYFLQNRVAIPETIQYISNGWNWFTKIALFIIIFIIFSRIILLLITTKINKESKLTKNILLSILLILSWISIIFSSPKKIDNIISLNIDYIKDIDNTWKDLLQENKKSKEYKDYIKSTKWEWKEVNIILIFAESLSAIDSANMWWNNNMPWFDEIQNNWIKFANFITNWTTSDTAHISTLFWVIPMRNIRYNNTPYSWYKLLMEPLPEFLNKQWYNTTFISTADLSFLNQREFLTTAWFQKIIWEEEFKDQKKYTFDSAPDWDLYKRALQEINNQTWKYFLWLQTISYHKPYDTPIWKSEELALKYSDNELFKFYKWLKEIWFFDNWILIIVWDHRKMNAAEEWEREIFGDNRYTRSVATILWTWIEIGTTNENIIQHTDIYNSIKKLVWNWSVQIDKTYNDIFKKERIGRKRWITNSSFYIENWYTVTTEKWETTLFKNLSNLSKDNVVYNYFSSFLEYEFWINKQTEDDNQWINDETIIIWHRWAIEKAPENTLESFLAANELWADWIELDVSYTKDYENIVAHWDLLYASNCTNKKVWNYNLEWIQKNCKLVNWEEYMTLENMLELIDGLFDYYFIEIKVYDESLWVQQTLDAIQTVKHLKMQDRVIFISYSDSAKKVLKIYPDIIFWWDTYNVNDLDFIWENNSKYFLAPHDLLTSDIINKAKNLWKKVVTYTVNDTWTFEKMVDYWVDIILTDDIKLLKNYEETKNPSNQP